MYEWLPEAVADDATVITANRRLARVLQQEYAQRQVDRGVLAWRSPRIQAWPDWLDGLLRSAHGQEGTPTRINRYHSALLWERCLKQELGDDAIGLGNLVRLARDTRQRLADWNVGIRDVARHAQSADHKVFAAAAGRYLGRLERNAWVDDAGLVECVIARLRERRISVQGRVTFAGFDRDRPSVLRVRECLSDLGCEVTDAPDAGRDTAVTVHTFETSEAELRAAGAWARARLESDPGARLAIVAGGLERDAEQSARLVREGLMPGYRLSREIPAEALNVSYGRRLSKYPLVAVAILWLRWLARGLRAADVSQLLRSPLVGSVRVAGRARLELRLRSLPDREWLPAMVTAALRGKEETPDAADWLQRVAGLSKARRTVPASAPPAAWAIMFDDILRAAGWPGESALDSADFQLVNRWRDLLNDLARMDLVSPRMSLDAALQQLESMAADAVYQPEADLTRVHLLGPLEAAGLEFDGLWVTGLTAAQWPPHPNPSALVARRLQEKSGMPDATPADTVEYARRLLSSLLSGAAEVIGSYPAYADDAEQTQSELLDLPGPQSAPPPPDPGWFAVGLVDSSALQEAADRVPEVVGEERLAGGAGTLQNQLVDPFTAFSGGRLAIRTLDAQAQGLPALLRGNLVHDALYRLYFDLPSRSDIIAWSDVPARIERAVDLAFARHEQHADQVLLRLLAMERVRVAGLLSEFLQIDSSRDAFVVDGIERKFEFLEAGLRIELRIDRIDRLPDGRIVIIDYKTGAEKKFLDRHGEPRDIQLVTYACAVAEPVAALALANIDSRAVGFHGAGTGFSDDGNWPAQLESWTGIVRGACMAIAQGDVRINGHQSAEAARPLNLLSRFTELRNAR